MKLTTKLNLIKYALVSLGIIISLAIQVGLVVGAIHLVKTLF